MTALHYTLPLSVILSFIFISISSCYFKTSVSLAVCPKLFFSVLSLSASHTLKNLFEKCVYPLHELHFSDPFCVLGVLRGKPLLAEDSFNPLRDYIIGYNIKRI